MYNRRAMNTTPLIKPKKLRIKIFKNDFALGIRPVVAVYFKLTIGELKQMLTLHRKFSTSIIITHKAIKCPEICYSLSNGLQHIQKE